MARKYYSIPFVVVLIIVVGCVQTKNSFVVMRDVPQIPSFTVIPFNNYHYQIDFAAQVEEALVTLGVKTVNRPTVKEITIAKGVGVDKEEMTEKIKSMLLSGKSAQSISIEEYLAYDEIKSDYVVFADKQSERIKIVRVKTKEILATFTIYHGQLAQETRDYRFKKEIQDALIALGIKVRELSPPLQIQQQSQSTMRSGIKK